MSLIPFRSRNRTICVKPERWNFTHGGSHFSLSSGERAGVRASVKLTETQFQFIGARALARFNIDHPIDIHSLVYRSLSHAPLTIFLEPELESPQ